MNCPIDLPSGELCGFSPNIKFLETSLEASMPDRISGTLIVWTSPSGAVLKFAGSEEWSGIHLDSEIIPRWMFAEIAFRELIELRVQTYVALLEQMKSSPLMEPDSVRSATAWATGR